MPLPVLLPAAMLALAAPQATAQSAVAADPPGAPSYADVADLVLASPVIADVTVASTARIKGAEAAGLPPDTTRFYVTAQVAALLRGPGAVPPRVGYLLDAPLGERGRVPRYAKSRVLIFARTVAGRPDQLQLVRPDAQAGWSAALDARVREITREIVAPDAPPVVTGVGEAFHVPGSLPGESETQIFLATQDRRPVSLSILRRPGEQPRWAVALSEIVDEAAGPPRPDTLLWYRLACALPPELPAASTAALDATATATAREDYRFVIASLGRCVRGGTISGGGAPG